MTLAEAIAGYVDAAIDHAMACHDNDGTFSTLNERRAREAALEALKQACAPLEPELVE